VSIPAINSVWYYPPSNEARIVERIDGQSIYFLQTDCPRLLHRTLEEWERLVKAGMVEISRFVPEANTTPLTVDEVIRVLSYFKGFEVTERRDFWNPEHKIRVQPYGRRWLFGDDKCCGGRFVDTVGELWTLLRLNSLEPINAIPGIVPV
jgi:hypothetical protein